MFESSIGLAILALAASLMSPVAADPLVVGRATYYNPPWMQEAYANRLAWGQVEPCPECVGMVALLDPEYIGRHVWLQRPGMDPEGPFLVVDCAQRDHFVERERQGRIVEVSAEVAQAHGFFEVGPVDVGVWFVEPPWLRNVKER